MAKSVSQKKLSHLLKNGMNVDPRNRRGDFGDLSGVSKSTPTLVTKRRRAERKYKGGYGQGNRDHTYCCVSGL